MDPGTGCSGETLLLILLLVFFDCLLFDFSEVGCRAGVDAGSVLGPGAI